MVGLVSSPVFADVVVGWADAVVACCVVVTAFCLTYRLVNTGFSTYLGSMGKQINSKKEITNFERGMNNITKLLIRYIHLL